MKISGFTFIKNGLSLGYPFIESVESISSLCDEVIINVGFDDEALIEDDGTYELIVNKFKEPKYKIIKSYWNPNSLKHGLVLSEQTNIALEAATGDYAIYIQGDECVHEKDLDIIKNGILKLESNQEADGLVFNYHHFYGNTNIVKVTKKTYRQEIRVIRNKRGIKSWLDAQGFRYSDDEKVKCLKIEAYIYHYGWARQEATMSKKTKAFNRLYHGDKAADDFFKYSRIWGLRSFNSTHPKFVKKWIQENTNETDILSLPLDISFKDSRIILSDFIEYITGIRLGEYQNFKLIG